MLPCSVAKTALPSDMSAFASTRSTRNLRLELRGGYSHTAGQIGECAKVVIDERLTAQADDLAEGAELVGLRFVGERADAKFAGLARRLQHRRGRHLDAVLGAEVARRRLAGDALQTARRGGVSLPHGAADRVRP